MRHIANIKRDHHIVHPQRINLRGKLLGEHWDAYKDSKGHDGIIDPAALAETYWHLHSQPKNCWTHELDLRPHNDTPWWNDNPIVAINK